MTKRKEFYKSNPMYIPQDLLHRGEVPDDYHIFTSNESISVCLHYVREKNDEKVSA